MVSRLDQHVLGNLRVDGDINLQSDLNASGDVFSLGTIQAAGMLVGRRLAIADTTLAVGSTTAVVSTPLVSSSDVWVPRFAYSQVVSTFAAPGLSALTWTVGWTGGGALGVDADALLLAGDSDGLTLGRYQREDSHRGVALDATELHTPDGDNELSVTVTATGADLDTLTKGGLEVYVWYLLEPVK